MLVLIQQRALFFFKGRFLSFFLLLVDARATVDSLFLFFFSPPPSFLPLSPRAAMTRHFAAAISLLAVIVFLGIASYAQVSRRLFEARRSAEKGKNRNPRETVGARDDLALFPLLAIRILSPPSFFFPRFATPRGGRLQQWLRLWERRKSKAEACEPCQGRTTFMGTVAALDSIVFTKTHARSLFRFFSLPVFCPLYADLCK